MKSEFEEYLNSFSRLGKRQEGLGRARALMRELGDPQDSLRFIHVTGTNGKGSICEMLGEAFAKGGYITGLFTSPYIIEYNDRIRINGENIKDRELDELLAPVKAAVDRSGYGQEFSQFEITMAAALIFFKEKKCDIVIFEAGLGGLLDCTNIIKDNVCSVIGSVELDHTAVLGDTIEQIAYQKAGIIKKGCPCILSPCNDERAVEVFRDAAGKMSAELIIPDITAARLISGGALDNSFEYKGCTYTPAMTGEHQIRNALAVIEACNSAKKEFDITDNEIKYGIENARLHGRAEILAREPLIISDGGHNPDAARALAKVLKGFCGGEERFYAIIGMSADKSIDEYITTVMPYIDEFITVDDFSERAINKNELEALIKGHGGAARSAKTLEAALKEIKSTGRPCVICGSLYLTSAVCGIMKG